MTALRIDAARAQTVNHSAGPRPLIAPSAYWRSIDAIRTRYRREHEHRMRLAERAATGDQFRVGDYEGLNTSC